MTPPPRPCSARLRPRRNSRPSVDHRDSPFPCSPTSPTLHPPFSIQGTTTQIIYMHHACSCPYDPKAPVCCKRPAPGGGRGGRRGAEGDAAGVVRPGASSRRAPVYCKRPAPGGGRGGRRGTEGATRPARCVPAPAADGLRRAPVAGMASPSFSSSLYPTASSLRAINLLRSRLASTRVNPSTCLVTYGS